MPENHSVERAAADGVAANDELLGQVHAHLHPRARALTRLVPAVGTFGYQTLKTLCLDRLNKIRQARLQHRGTSHRLGQIRQDAVLKQFAPSGQRFISYVSNSQHLYVEHVEVDVRAAVLEQLKGRFSIDIKRDHLAVDYRFVRQACERRGHTRIARREVLIVAGPEPDLAAALNCERPIAVEFDLVPSRRLQTTCPCATTASAR